MTSRTVHDTNKWTFLKRNIFHAHRTTQVVGEDDVITQQRARSDHLRWNVGISPPRWYDCSACTTWSYHELVVRGMCLLWMASASTLLILLLLCVCFDHSRTRVRVCTSYCCFNRFSKVVKICTRTWKSCSSLDFVIFRIFFKHQHHQDGWSVGKLMCWNHSSSSAHHFCLCLQLKAPLKWPIIISGIFVPLLREIK